jgi:hypothetical protein
MKKSTVITKCGLVTNKNIHSTDLRIDSLELILLFQTCLGALLEATAERPATRFGKFGCAFMSLTTTDLREPILIFHVLISFLIYKHPIMQKQQQQRQAL